MIEAALRPNRSLLRAPVAAVAFLAAAFLAIPGAAGSQTSGSGSASSTVSAPEAEGSVDTNTLMSDQPIEDVVVGDADAPVTIVEYASMTCPHCADFHENTYPTIKKEFIDTGKAKFILREFPFDPRALAAFALARCTANDDQRTAMVDVLFDRQAEWARAENASQALFDVARQAGMSRSDFEACLTNRELQQKIIATQERGQNDFGVSATPTFFINGDKYAGALPADQMSAVINQKLSGSGS